MANSGQLKHCRLEVVAHRVLVEDEALPFASSAGVAGELRVRLQTDLTGEAGFNFALVASRTREKGCGKKETTSQQTSACEISRALLNALPRS